MIADLYGYVLFSSILGGLPVILLTAHLATKYEFGVDLSHRVPSFLEFAWGIAASIVLQEVWFYYFHRLAHWKPFFKHIHYKHHQYKAPVALAAVYAHPVEMGLVNIPSILFGPVVLQMHLLTTLAWLITASVVTEVRREQHGAG